MKRRGGKKAEGEEGDTQECCYIRYGDGVGGKHGEKS